MMAPSLFASEEGPRGEQSAEREVQAPTGTAMASPLATASLYRKYRPSSFSADELVGQEHIVRTLRNAISLNRVAHAYLFSGPRGTGKTTTARLLAKAVNCLAPDPGQRPCNACENCRAINASATPDIIEIDAASNRGIDDIRDLRERVRYAPAQLPSKVYIIDEAHQITGAAANAFLKTLEEPPAHSRFILATTDPEELLPTIVSRCQRFEFRRVSAEDVVRRLRTVAELENITVDDEALRMVARHATGSLRDALGLLEQMALLTDATSQAENASQPISPDTVRAVLGLSRNERIEALVDALAEHDAGGAIRVIQQALEDGEDPRQLNRQLVGYLRQLLLARSGGTSDADERARILAAKFSLEDLARNARRFSEIDFSIKHSPLPQLPLEVAVVEATAIPTPTASSAIPERQDANPSPEPAAQRPTLLRDRVREKSAVHPARAVAPTPPARPEPVPITPLRPTATNGQSTVQSPAGDALLDVEQIANLWPNVRADVKALNRRIEALLSEVDPVAISGNQITLAVPYPFHRDKLNSDEVREILGGVLSRLLNRNVSLQCILRGEMPATGISVAPSPAPTAPLSNQEAVPASNDEGAASPIRAAMNIFDAEEVDASVIAAAGLDGGSS
jgi:DNA polymerase-3 subunit gamma/tau